MCQCAKCKSAKSVEPQHKERKEHNRGPCQPKVQSKIKYYFKYSAIKKNLISSVNNIRVYVYEGDVYGDKLFKTKIGTIMWEQIVNENTNETKSTHNVTLSTGTISYVFFHKTSHGKTAPNTTLIAPLLCGTKRYEFWNSANYFIKLTTGRDDDTRTVAVYKK